MLLVACKIQTHQIQVKMQAVNDQAPSQLVNVFAESILDGNAIYCNMSSVNKSVDVNLSIPEAIHAVKTAKPFSSGLREWVYASIQLFHSKNGMSESIFNGFTEGLNRWKRCKSVSKANNLFAVLIAPKQSILIVFDECSSTVTIFDSHEHFDTHGSVIAQTEIANLSTLCFFIERLYFDVHESCPYEMELSFLERNDENPLIYIRKFIPFTSPD
ncbi:hypothetical protein Bhyg_17144 [Pseudolycoriella hygida]|uniref:Uncharacterized protein n=1 Tax=Pseudolycoriella hygida TaxID=35572 RepID=A0A9Q0MIY8_9DIPT|nr:hypothetical protein Bhyg_17144 [Pseudolycoriella hygida]